MALETGRTSQQAITPVAEELARLAVEVAPALRAYSISLDLWAQEMAIVLLCRRGLDRQGVLDHNGMPRESLLKHINSHTRNALQLLREMGMTRKVAAELQLDLAQAAQAALGAARHASEGHQVPAPVREFLEAGGFAQPQPTPQVVDHEGGPS